jgi:hypothetical protein
MSGGEQGVGLAQKIASFKKKIKLLKHFALFTDLQTLFFQKLTTALKQFKLKLLRQSLSNQTPSLQKFGK